MGSVRVLAGGLETTSGHGLGDLPDRSCNALPATLNGVDTGVPNPTTDSLSARHEWLKPVMPGYGGLDHESRFKQFAADYPERVSARIGYDEKLSHALQGDGMRADFSWYVAVRKVLHMHAASAAAACKRA